MPAVHAFKGAFMKAYAASNPCVGASTLCYEGCLDCDNVFRTVDKLKPIAEPCLIPIMKKKFCSPINIIMAYLNASPLNFFPFCRIKTVTGKIFIKIVIKLPFSTSMSVINYKRDG